jgi:hypothetical protein
MQNFASNLLERVVIYISLFIVFTLKKIEENFWYSIHTGGNTIFKKV